MMNQRPGFPVHKSALLTVPSPTVKMGTIERE
jgi:hypothetical protein